MSTEARRASHSPGPTTPPSPSTPPRPSHPPADADEDTREPDRRQPDAGTGPRETHAATPAGGAANGTAPVQPRGRTSGGTGAFDVRRPAAAPSADTGRAEGGAADTPVPAPSAPVSPSASSTSSSVASPPRPRFPSFGTGGQGRPVGTGGTPPPPPRASARFPDIPPAVGHGAPSPGTSPTGSATVPPQPTHGPTRTGRRRSAEQRPTAGRADARSTDARSTDARSTDARPEPPSEMTTRLSPVSLRASAPPRPTDRPDVPPYPATPAGPERGHAAPPGPWSGPGHPAAGAPAATPPTPAGPPRPTGPAPDPARDEAWAPASRPGADEPYGTGWATAAPSGPGTPDPAFSWSSPPAPGGASGSGRPVVTFARPEGYDENARPRPLGRRGRSQVVAAAVCLVLGVGLIGGAVAGSWLAGDSGEKGADTGFAAAANMWHSVPVDELFPPTVRGEGAGPGDADRVWTRIAVAPDSGCEDAFDPLLRKLFAPLGCERLLRATYTDATQSHVTTVGLLFTKADAAGMVSLAGRFDKERLDRRTDLIPRPYAAKGTAAAGFGAGQRATWAISVLTDAPVVVYAVSGWADGRDAGTPLPAEDGMESGATTAPAQAGLGHEARGLADRVERGLRKNVGTTTEQPS
ncbi:hypothetical protein [Streptomyces sp. P9-A2]|uniref:hypothetical protein n=1 Tax=Streptomyces sp. P9-A2 TaxID=3072284 RepID=UPI002FC93397